MLTNDPDSILGHELKDDLILWGKWMATSNFVVNVRQLLKKNRIQPQFTEFVVKCLKTI
jgi:hypothetical protein